MHVVCNLSVGGVSLSVTLGGAKETNVADYSKIINQKVQADSAWSAPHERAILARTAMLALYEEAFKAVSQARSTGASMDLEEWPQSVSDTVAIKFGGRELRFTHGPKHSIRLIPSGYAAGSKVESRDLALPSSSGESREWAESQMAEIVSLIMHGA